MFDFKIKGKVCYDPRDPRTKFQPWMCILKIDNSIGEYYRYWIKRELGLHGNRPIYGSHVTIVRCEQPKNPLAWKKHEGREIEIRYSPEIRNGEIYFWLPVKCGQLCEIRKELGLQPFPRVDFHCTVANLKGIDQNTVKPLKLPNKIFPFEKKEYFNRNY